MTLFRKQNEPVNGILSPLPKYFNQAQVFNTRNDLKNLYRKSMGTTVDLRYPERNEIQQDRLHS